jgi:hypothetical protein
LNRSEASDTFKAGAKPISRALLVVVGVFAALALPHSAAAVPPANDDFDGAKAVTPLPFSDTFHIPDLSLASDDPAACIWPTNKTAWYKLTPVLSQRVSFTTNAGVSIGLDLFTGTRGALTRVACTRNGYQTRLPYDVVAGTTYYLMVSAPSGWEIDLTVSAEIAPSGPPNDDFGSATQISSHAFADALDTTDAIDSLDDPVCEQWYLTNTVWYRWTAPGTRRVRLDTAGSTYEPAFAVYTGTRGALTQLGYCHYFIYGTPPALEFTAVAGRTYHFMVGTLAPQFGDGGLALSFSAKGLSSISLDASRSRVVYGGSVRLSGHVTAISDPAGDTVSVYRRPSAGVARKLAGTALVDAEGNFSLTLTPERTFLYEAEWAGDEESLAALSGRESVGVQVRIQGRLYRFHHRSGGYKIYRPGTNPLYVVTVAPVHRDKVGFRLQVKRNGEWRTYDTAAFPLNADGVVGVVLRHLARGTPYRIKATFRSDGDHLGASTSWSYLKIVA